MARVSENDKRDMHIKCNHSCGIAPFMVHSKLTLLCCAGCGVEMGRWEDEDDKAKGPVIKFSKEILSRQLTEVERENLR